MAHGRRDYADAIKAIGKGNPAVVKASLAYQALERIRTIYKIEGGLADLSPEERLYERQKSISPLIDEYFAWVKARIADTAVLPKGKTAKGLNYSVNQEIGYSLPTEMFRSTIRPANVPFAPSVWARRIGCS